jgi:hypothetical protein
MLVNDQLRDPIEIILEQFLLVVLGGYILRRFALLPPEEVGDDSQAQGDDEQLHPIPQILGFPSTPFFVVPDPD